MRHPFRYLFDLQAKTVLHRAQGGAPARFQGIFIQTGGQWATDMSDSGAPPPPQGKGGGQTGEAKEAANTLIKFLQPRAQVTQPSPAAPPRATEAISEGWVTTPQQQYINTERPAYDGTTPIIEQMLPEIANADENTKNTSMRDALAVARGYVTGVRPNGNTTGAALWAELLQRDGLCRHVLSRTWGLMHTTTATKAVFFDAYKEQPTARAAPPIDTAAKKYGVAPTTLNRLLVWAWAAAGPTDQAHETTSVTTARQKHRELAHRTKSFTQPLSDAFLETTWNPTPPTKAAATVAVTAATPAGATPYGGPPKGLAQMMKQHESPQGADADQREEPPKRKTDANGDDITTAAADGGGEHAPDPPRRHQEQPEGPGQPTPKAALTEDGDPNSHTALPKRTDGRNNDGTATTGGADDGRSSSSRRRLNETPDNNISLRHCMKYGTMIGETSVTVEDINDTAQYMIDEFVPIDPSESMAFMKAMSTLVQIEHFAMAHDVLMSECMQIAKMPRRSRAVAAGLLMNQIGIQQQMEEEANARTAAEGGGAHIIGHTDANDTHTTIRGGTPRMPHMMADGGGAATYGTHGTDAANTQGMITTRTSPPQPPLTQGHQGDGTATTGTGTQQRVHFDELQFGDDDDQPPGGETMTTLYASATAATRNLQLRQADTQGQQHTFAQHQYPADKTAVTAIPVPTAQQRTGTSAAASSAQPNGTRTSLQQTLPLNFYGPDMQAQIMAQKQAEQDALQLQQACARNAAVHAAAKAAYEAQVAAQQTAAALRQQAPPAGPPPPTAPPTTTTTTTSLPSRVRALLSGVQPAQAQSILLTMAGAVPENAIPPAILEKMTMDDHAAVVDAFLQQTEATDISSIPPFGTSAFSHFWSLVTRFQLEAKEKQASSGAKVHADKSTGKLLERSTAEAAHAPTQSAAANVYSSKECVDALKKFVDTKRVGSVDAVLAQVPAAARAVLMAKFDADAGTVLGADGQEAKRGALSIITEVLPQRVKNVIRSSPHSPDLNFPDREKLAKHVTHALYSTHAAPWTFVRTKQGAKLKNWDDWLLYMQHEPERWVNDTANAIDLFANAITAAHGYGAQATGPADTTATADDDTDNSKSLLIGSTNTDAVTYHCNWKWLQPWVEQFHNVATTIKNSQARSNESRVTVKPEFIIGKSNSILRQLVESFVAAIAEGQRYGTPIEYSEMVKQHYHGEGKGLSDSIQRFRNSSNPLMSSLMRDAMAQLFADNGGAELAIRTMTAVTAPTHPPAAGNATDGGRRQRQSQQAQHQSPAPAPAPAPTPSPAPAPTPTAPAAPPPQTLFASTPPCPPWMMMQPPPWWSAPPSHAPDANAHQQPAVQLQQEPPHAQQPKAGMLPPNQQPRPPPLPPAQARNPTGTASQGLFEIKGIATTRFHPFAQQYGKFIRDEMTRTYNEDTSPEQTRAKSICRPVITAIRRATGDQAACDKWMTLGRCREKDCPNTHPEWQREWDGMWLHQNCAELASFAKVPITWRPS